MKRFGNPSLAIVFVFAFSALGFSAATDVYITPDGNSQGVCTSSPHNPAWFNTAANWGSGSNQIGPGTTVHLCGTFTFAAGSTGLIFQGSGTNGNPVKLLFETGAILQAPYFASSGGGTPAGGITLGNGQSWITVDGNNLTGTIQNTANGSSLANQQSSTGISAFNCSNCVVKNLTIANLYVNVIGDSTLGDSSIVRAIDFNGSNWTISGNKIHDCGWCLLEFATNGDTQISIFNNEIFNYAHGWAIAPGTGAAVSNLFFYGNHIHDSANWGAPGCFAHIDGIHAFGNATSSIDQIFVHDNLFDGPSGTCPTGFIFVEGGASSTPAHMRTSAWWNNVFIVDASDPHELTQGWFGLFAGDSGTQTVVNNTFIGNNSTDNTVCFAFDGESGSVMSALTFKNNTIARCGNPITVGRGIGVNLAAANNNFYGAFGSNAFTWQNTTVGTFAAWKTACSCDGQSLQNDNNGLLNADGSPQAGSPVIGLGANFISLATGKLSTLSSDTTKGNTRTPVARPSSGVWDTGAYQFNTNPLNANSPPAPPTGLTGVVN